LITSEAQTLVPRGSEQPSFDYLKARTAAARLICADGEFQSTLLLMLSLFDGFDIAVRKQADRWTLVASGSGHAKRFVGMRNMVGDLEAFELPMPIKRAKRSKRWRADRACRPSLCRRLQFTPTAVA
jgi:hypothetical protein